jgi:hypothetical protein
MKSPAIKISLPVMHIFGIVTLPCPDGSDAQLSSVQMFLGCQIHNPGSLPGEAQGFRRTSLSSPTRHTEREDKLQIKSCLLV